MGEGMGGGRRGEIVMRWWRVLFVLNLWWGSWLAQGQVYVGQVCRDVGFLGFTIL